MNLLLPVESALISVSDKTGISELCDTLKKFGTKFYATSGTAEFLERDGLSPLRLESITNYPELMQGRVKTLHPKIFGGILARRDDAQDIEEIRHHGIPLFDIVVGNLYPFWEHLGEGIYKQAAFVDIGGPSLLRAGAKNHRWVTVVSHPGDYAEFIRELTTHNGKTSESFRRRCAFRTLQRTSDYDSLIAAEWGNTPEFPTHLPFKNPITLRYGENPHQKAAWCRSENASWEFLQGKELSYNNLLDAESALQIVGEFEVPAVAIVKHNSPCGVAAGAVSAPDLFSKALAADSKSAFGGVVAFNRPVDVSAAERLASIFIEVIVAPDFSPEAKKLLIQKKNLRVLCWEKPSFHPLDVRHALGGWLLQTPDDHGVPPVMNIVTPTPLRSAAWEDLKFAWLVVKHVRSNAIVIAKGGATVGIGAGQMSRVDAVELAIKKSLQESVQGAVLASDGFFPFRDSIDCLKETGIVGIIQPGGSQRDSEVIAACNEIGIAMVFTGERHFRH